MSNWNGKIKCTYNNSDFTIDKIYEIKNGELIDDTKYSFGFFNNIDEINNDLDSQFEEVISWDGKVRCFKDNNFGFIKNTIYNVINGNIVASNGRKFPESSNGYNYIDINDLNEDLCLMFEEITENNYVNQNKCCNSNVSKSDLPIKIPVLSELLGVVPNEHFKVKFDNGTISTVIYWIDTEGWMCSDSLYNLSLNDTAIRLINKLYQIVKLSNYQFTENEITILSALYLNDYFYIARDEDGELWTFEENPEECESGEYLTDTGNAFKLKDEFFQQVQWGNILDVKFELDKLN